MDGSRSTGKVRETKGEGSDAKWKELKTRKRESKIGGGGRSLLFRCPLFKFSFVFSTVDLFIDIYAANLHRLPDQSIFSAETLWICRLQSLGHIYWRRVLPCWLSRQKETEGQRPFIFGASNIIIIGSLVELTEMIGSFERKLNITNQFFYSNLISLIRGLVMNSSFFFPTCIIQSKIYLL